MQRLNHLGLALLFGFLGSAAMVAPLQRTTMPSPAQERCAGGDAHAAHPDWGFFAHRRINRLAVLTLPPKMMVFFKKNIDWVADHAVDPDMRRYATKHEAPRHYIDLDNYGKPPFDNLPRHWTDAMAQYAEVWVVPAPGDTALLFGPTQPVPDSLQRVYRRYVAQHLLPRHARDEESLDPDSLHHFLQQHGLDRPFQSAHFKDRISEHGTLPWNLQQMQRKMTEAFRTRNARLILKYCAEMGHYIGDAHVPLHTTSNYNGQKTGQHGIHGFWESRIPELFADASYDYFVGKPEYWDRPDIVFWNAVLASNAMVDSVLNIEKALRGTFPADRQMCPDLRLGISVIAPCRDFAAAYQTSLQGMVERRMRAAIRAVASAWYTAWVDAGQPDLSKMEVPLPSEMEQQEEQSTKKAYEQGKIIGRPEEH
jgi:hypothetical protein